MFCGRQLHRPAAGAGHSRATGASTSMTCRPATLLQPCCSAASFAGLHEVRWWWRLEECLLLVLPLMHKALPSPHSKSPTSQLGLMVHGACYVIWTQMGCMALVYSAPLHGSTSASSLTRHLVEGVSTRSLG